MGLLDIIEKIGECKNENEAKKIGLKIIEMIDFNYWNAVSSKRDLCSFLVAKRRDELFSAEHQVASYDYMVPIESYNKQTPLLIDASASHFLGPGEFYNTDVAKHYTKNIIHNGEYLEFTNPENYGDIDNALIVLTLLYNKKMFKQTLLYALYTCSNRYLAHIYLRKEFWEILSTYKNNMIIDYIVMYANYIIRYDEIMAPRKILDYGRIFNKIEDYYNIPSFNNRNVNLHPFLNIYNDGYKTRSLPFYIGADNRKINSREIFEKRFEIITRGIFKNIDMKKYKAVFTGSLLVACAATNPIEREYVTFDCYIDDLYPGFECEEDENYDYESYKTKELSEDIVQICKDRKKNPPEPVVYNKKSHSDIDISIHCSNIEEYRANAYTLYEKIRENTTRISNKPIYIKRVFTARWFKYIIYGPGLHRNIDLFNTYKTPKQLVKGYHLDVVRMYYDFADVSMLNSCYIALITGINFLFNWVPSKTPIAHIICKYIKRGYTTYLNFNEIHTCTKILESENLAGTPFWNTYQTYKRKKTEIKYHYIENIGKIDFNNEEELSIAPINKKMLRFLNN